MNIHLNKLPPIQLDNNFIGVDSEWIGLNSKQLHRPTSGRFAALSLCTDDENTYVYTDPEIVGLALGRIENCVWCIHKSSFDIRHLRRLVDIPPRSRLWDSLLIERIMWNGYYQGFALDDLSRRYLDIYVDKSLRKTFEEDQGELTQDQIEYAAKDAWLGYKVAMAQKDKITKNQFKVWREIDGPCLWAVLDFQGFRVDIEKWEALAEINKQRQKDIDDNLPFNPRSPKQVKEFFKDELKISLKTTQADTLKKLEGTTGWEWAEKILDSRKFGKRVSTYGMNFLQDFIEQDEDGNNVVYSDFDINRAETGRFSSSSPNVQNIPARETLEFRECFIPRPGNKLIVADYAAQEPRITAYITQDPVLMDIFRSGQDPYKVMQELYVESTGKPDPGRRRMKDIFLGLTYGLTEYGMAKKYDISKEEAREFLGEAHRMFPVASETMEQRGQSKTKVETVAGRTCWLNPYSYQVENNARNSPIQGSAADMMKLAINQVHKNWDFDCPFGIVAPVHDELVLDVCEDQVNEIAEFVSLHMKDVAEKMCPGIPFYADAKIVDNWGEAK